MSVMRVARVVKAVVAANGDLTIAGWLYTNVKDHEPSSRYGEKSVSHSRLID